MAKAFDLKRQFKNTLANRPLRILHGIDFEVREGHQNPIRSQFMKQIPKSRMTNTKDTKRVTANYQTIITNSGHQITMLEICFRDILFRF
jgi:hypothetical protein